MSDAPLTFPLDIWGDVESDEHIARVRVERDSHGGFVVRSIEHGAEYDMWIESAEDVQHVVAALKVTWPGRATADPADNIGIRVVHEGRGGYIEIGEARYPIDHVENGRFAISFPAGQRRSTRQAHRRALEALVASEPEKWALDDSSRVRREGRR